MHIDVHDHTFQAIAALAEKDKVSHTEAHRRLIRYGELISTFAAAAEALGENQMSISVPEGDGRVMLTWRRPARRRWWQLRTPRHTVERLLFPGEPELNDNRFIVEQPDPSPDP